MFAALLGLLAGTEPAFAPPVVAWAAAALVYAGIGAETAAIIAQIAVSVLTVGLTYVANALLAPTASKKPSGVTGSVQAGGALPRSFILGEFATAGSLVYVGTWGQDGKTPNAYLTYVIALSDLPMEALTEMWVGSSKVTLSTATLATQGYAVPEYNTAGQDYLWIKFYDGTQGSADSFLLSTFGSDPNYPWASDMVAPGTAYVIVTARLNTSLFSGFPQYRFAGQGAKLYDPRLDSTVGGSGSQRFNTPSTWTYSNNPKLIEYNILLGISDSAGWLWGPQGMSQPRLPFAAWAAAMNECDAAVLDDTLSDVAQYRCGVEVSVDMQPVDVIDALNAACNGKTAEIGGTYKPIAGAAGSSVFAFTDDGVIVSASNTASPFPSLANVINGIAATYPEPRQGWAMTAAPPRADTAAQTADGKLLLANVQYAAVPYSNQVQRLMASALLEGRKFRTHTLVLPPQAWVLEPTDVATWSSNINGYAAKQFTVKTVSVLPNCDIQVGIAEVDPADYDFDPTTDYIAHLPIAIPLELPPLLETPVDDVSALLRQALVSLDDLGEAMIHQQWTIGGAAISANRALAFARIELSEAIINGDTAEASARIDVEAVASGASASGLFQIVAVAGPGDAAASLAMEVAASAGGVFSEAGIYLDALVAGGSRIRLTADQIELDGTVMTGGGITGAMLEAGAATGHVSGHVAGPTTQTAPQLNTWTDLVTCTIISLGGPLEIDAMAVVDNADNGAHNVWTRISLDGVGVIWPATYVAKYPIANTQSQFYPAKWIETRAAGTYTYRFQWKTDSTALSAYDAVITADEIRK